MTDTQFYMDDLKSDKCRPCGGKKKPMNTFCRKCFYRLPKEMRTALYQHIGDGYEAAYNAALHHLIS